MINILHTYYIYILFACICLFPIRAIAQTPPSPSIHQTDDDALAKLQALEKRAKESYDNRQYTNAFTLYREYEIQMRNAGYDVIQPDLLHNQMLAALKAQKFGYAIAYLQQLEIIAPSRDNRQKLAAIQSLVEYNISQQYPDAIFVRGKTDKFQTWQRVHRYSKPELFTFMIAIWAAFFLIIGAIYLLPYFYDRKPQKLFLSLILLQLLLICALVLLISNRQSTENLQFAVLLDSTSLKSDISPNPKSFEEPGYAEGLIVKVISQNADWAFIERADGKTAWVSNTDIYKLRSVDRATMNLGIKAYRESRNETVPPMD